MKGFKKLLATILSIALVVSSITIYNGKDITAASDELCGSVTIRFAASAAYCSSNLRSGATTPLKVNFLTDGNTTGTYFIIANTTSGDVNPWFAVDLGSVKDLNKVNIVPGAEGYANAYPISYKIQVALETTNISAPADINSLTWIDVAEVTDGTMDAKSTTFISQNARYVRILVDSYSSYCSLYEMSVFGTDASKPYEEETTTEEPTITTKPYDPNGTKKVLFIGNSMTYYNTLAKVVQGLGEKNGHKIECDAVTVGGTNLIFHSTNANTQAAIKKGGYDAVVLQDIVGSFDEDNLMIGANSLTETIEHYNPGAQIIFYEPWPVKDSLTGTGSLLPYFTHGYMKAAKTYKADLAPAGEAWYDIYTNLGYDYYCADGKHPRAVGTFVSATSVYYTLYKDDNKMVYTAADQSSLNNIINSNIAYSGDSTTTSYDLTILNNISDKSYLYAHKVDEVLSDTTGKSTYVSVAGDYNDPSDGMDLSDVKPITETIVDNTVFSSVNGDIAIGCKSYTSNASQAASNAFDGNVNTRWETTFSDPHWITVDLGSIRNVSKVGFIWEGAYAKKYYIQISDDNENWKTIAELTASSVKTVQVTLDHVYQTRYVRMYGVKRGTQYGYSLWEMGVWEGTQEPTTQETTTQETTKLEPITSQELTTVETTSVVPTPTTAETTSVVPTPTTEIQPTTGGVVPNTTSKNTNKPTIKPTVAITTKVIAPGKTTITKIKSSKRKASLKLKSIKSAKGYMVQYSSNKKFKKAKTIFTSKIQVAIKKLKSKKKYYFRAKAYVKNGKKKVYSAKWSKVKVIKIK